MYKLLMNKLLCVQISPINYQLIQPLLSLLLTFRQPLLPSSERLSIRCHCDGQQVIIDERKLVGPSSQFINFSCSCQQQTN